MKRISVNIPDNESLRFWKLAGREAMSEPFCWTLTLLGEDAALDCSGLLAKSVTISIPGQNLLMTRYLNGVITSARATPLEHSGIRYTSYTLTVEPDIWPMKRDRDMRIFQGKTVPEIVKEVFNKYNVSIDDQLTESFRVWEYCVQYQESSLDFVSRLMELEGIAYHFRHSADGHRLVLTDSGSQFLPITGYEVIPYHPTLSGGVTDEEGIAQWSMENRVTPGLYSLDDYNFRKPNAWLFQARQSGAAPQQSGVDVYEWPGHYSESDQGKDYAEIHQQRWQVENKQIYATATASGIAPGHLFQLINAPFADNNGSYLVTSAEYQFAENPYSTSDSGESLHRIDFTVIPAETIYRPERATPWPRTYGPQTAKVVGPEGESIWTDRYGRVKVKFHWDRQGKGDDTSSCWIRVSSAWAGQGYGGVQIPRVGDEVVVDFINGDPDRPIVTGRVYNESNMPPWELPAAATVMGFMTRSKDGHKDNASYFFFDDSPGSELIDVHAEKNMKISVENDQHINIDGQRTTTIKKEQQDDIAGDANFHYRQNRITTVDGEETSIFNDRQLVTIKKGRNLNITEGGDRAMITGCRETVVTGKEFYHVTDTLSEVYDKGQLTVIASEGKQEDIHGGVKINVSGGGWTQTVSGDINISSPGKIVINSNTGIEMNAPSSVFKPKFHSLSVTAFSESITGNSLSGTGVSSSVTLLSNSAALATSSFKLKDWSKTVFKAESSGVTINIDVAQITNSVTNITNNTLFIIT